MLKNIIYHIKNWWYWRQLMKEVPVIRRELILRIVLYREGVFYD